MKKFTGKSVRSICATAMAMTLAMPAALSMNATVAEASVLDSALATYDFEGGTDSLIREGETYLKLVDGKPVIENGKYALSTSTALPEVAEDTDRGRVLKFKDSTKIDKYEKTAADATEAAVVEGVDVVTAAALNQEYAVGDLIQQKERIGGRVKLTNPFKGMTFDETDKNAGVSISYWVKVPVIKVNSAGEKVTDGTGTDRGANSTTVVFNNSGRTVMDKDDYIKYLACKSYDEAVKTKDTETLKQYDMGKQKIVKDAQGNAYVLYQDYGKLLRFNPNYPDADAASQAAVSVQGTTATAKKGGWFVPEKEADGKIEVWDDEGKSYKICSFVNTGSITEDQNQYELFAYHYAKEDDKKNGYSSKSKLREEKVDGSLQISTDNDFSFIEDNFREESYLNVKGETVKKAVDGVKISNPNSDIVGKFHKLRQQNHFYFDGDEMVTNLETGAEEWHYVTVVIQNDWVISYVDGVAADPELDYQYIKETPGLKATEHEFGKACTEKMFNGGVGLRGIFGLGSGNIKEWPENGTANAGPSNTVAIDMLDWIAHEGTELYLGGTGLGSEALAQGYGTVEGVCMDDVSFFGTALTEEEVKILYEEVADIIEPIEPVEPEQSVTLGDVDHSGKVDLTDAQITLKAALKIQKLEDVQMKAADVDVNGKVELPDAQKILKVALKIDSGF